MSPTRFGYKTVVTTDDSGRVGSLIAYRLADDRSLQAVMWAADRKTWIYAPGIAVQFIYDPELMQRAKEVDRQQAESTAHETLLTDLPTEPKLAAMCDEGARMGWEFGPPRPPEDDD